MGQPPFVGGQGQPWTPTTCFRSRARATRTGTQCPGRLPAGQQPPGPGGDGGPPPGERGGGGGVGGPAVFNGHPLEETKTRSWTSPVRDHRN
eukprot:2555292-Pyramimonas_sp.AAC.1